MSEPLKLPVPLIREQLKNSFGSQAQVWPAIVALISFTITIAASFAATIFFNNKIVFLAGLIIAILDSVIVYFVLTAIFRKKFATPNRDRVLASFAPYVKQLTQTGFDAAADHCIAIIRIGFNLNESSNTMLAIVDDGLRFYFTRLIQISQLRRRLGDNEQLNSQFSDLQDSLIHQMKQTQSGKKPSLENKKALDGQVDGIQSKLDKIETINRVALNLTTDLARLRNSAEEFLDATLSPEARQAKSAQVLKEQLEREKKVVPELQRLGLH